MEKVLDENLILKKPFQPLKWKLKAKQVSAVYLASVWWFVQHYWQTNTIHFATFLSSLHFTHFFYAYFFTLKIKVLAHISIHKAKLLIVPFSTCYITFPLAFSIEGVVHQGFSYSRYYQSKTVWSVVLSLHQILTNVMNTSPEDKLSRYVLDLRWLPSILALFSIP